MERHIKALLTELNHLPTHKGVQEEIQAYYYHSQAVVDDLMWFLPSIPEAQEIVVVPDGPLSLLPFGMLAVDQKSDQSNWRQLTYALERFRFRYGLSGTLLIRGGRANIPRMSLRDVKKSDVPDPPPSLAMAPQGEEMEKGMEKGLNFSLFGSIGNFRSLRDADGSLPFSSREVQEVARHFDGQYFTGKEASKAAFGDATQGSLNVIHLAMHATAEDSVGLFFADGFLHDYEMYGMDMEAELAVLSACGTGLGEVLHGEGIMSISRAFQYAGCDNVVMSLWDVDDQASAHLMEYFYTHLAEGLGKSEALRRAQLDYLEKGGPGHPSFWGAFVIYGDNDPVQVGKADDTQRATVGWMALFGLVLAASVWWLKKGKVY